MESFEGWKKRASNRRKKRAWTMIWPWVYLAISGYYWSSAVSAASLHKQYNQYKQYDAPAAGVSETELEEDDQNEQPIVRTLPNQQRPGRLALNGSISVNVGNLDEKPSYDGSTTTTTTVSVTEAVQEITTEAATEIAQTDAPPTVPGSESTSNQEDVAGTTVSSDYNGEGSTVLDTVSSTTVATATSEAVGSTIVNANTATTATSGSTTMTPTTTTRMTTITTTAKPIETTSESTTTTTAAVISAATTTPTTTITTTAPTTILILTTPKMVEPTTASTPSSSVDQSVQPSPTSLGGNVTGSATEVSRPEDLTLLIKIVFEGNWQDVCKSLPQLKKSLAELVNNASSEQTLPLDRMGFFQNQCLDNLSLSSWLESENQLPSVFLYIIDSSGNVDRALMKALIDYYNENNINSTVKIKSFELIEAVETGNTLVIVVVSCAVVISIISLAAIIFVMKKRRNRFSYGERCRPVSKDAYSLYNVSAFSSFRRNKNTVRDSKRSYGNPTFEDPSVVPSHPLNYSGLSTFSMDNNVVTEEFTEIPQVSSKIDELPDGAELKNRYANVVPLPETRVPLHLVNNEPLSEYINASYVRGPKNASKYYIACQAPLENTVTDFWRMIWEQQCKVIVMLTDLVENGVDKCSEYIPPLEVTDCHRLYGDFQITLKKREPKDKYAISTLHLKNLESNTFREVFHLWYLWPTHGVPSDASSLLAVIFETRALNRSSKGPIVVHCSPGTGRTGTFIALDLAIRQYEATRTVDVPRVVYTIRRDRAGAVQTRQQYAFIYKALYHYSTKLSGGAVESF